MSTIILPEKRSNVKCLDHLRDYLKAGFNVIPLKERGKTPAVKAWKPLLKKPLTESELTELYQTNPKLNIGLITGSTSGGLVIIDVDHSPPEELTFLIAQNPTVTVRTSRGRHYYYLSETKLSNLNFDWGELRADGVYVVAPPSIHPDGTQYRFMDDSGFDQISKLPEPILAFLTSSSDKGLKTKKYPSNEFKYPLLGYKSKTYSLLGYFQSTYKNLEIAFKVVRLCGVNVSKLGQAFKCPIHPEDNPSAALWRGKNGVIMLHEFHQGDNYWTLPEMYASYICHKKEFMRLSKSQMAEWWIRALEDAGCIKLPQINHRQLPVNVSRNARRVYEGFIRLIQVRKFYNPKQSEEAPFSHGFGCDWCGYSEKRSVRLGLEWLLKNGYIEKTKEAVLCGKREATLYRLKRG